MVLCTTLMAVIHFTVKIISSVIMSTQKGNTSRTRPQKHHNKTAFKNNLHDTSHQTKLINSIQVSDVCAHCKEIIEWKIKYKKYKPLSQPKKCVKCEQKTVRNAYHVMCLDCGRKLELCTKCCKAKELIQAVLDKKEQEKLDEELQSMLQSLPERKRRTFIRYMNRAKSEKGKFVEEDRDDLKAKIDALQVSSNSGDEFLDYDNTEDNES